MKVLICDSESLAVQHLIGLIAQIGHEVIATASHGQEAIKLARKYCPDVILFEIKTPEMNEMEFAQVIRQMDFTPAIAFCIAKDQSVIHTFHAQADVYLLKPISKQDLQKALEHLVKPTQAQKSQIKQQESMEKLNTKRTQIVAKTHRGVELIALNDIYYFLADQKYVTVRHKNGTVLIDETLKELEQEFDDFVRVHRNALVSMQYLDGLESLGAGQYQVRCQNIEERLAVSRRHLVTLRERFQKNQH